MALKSRSLFLYGLQVTTQNRYIDFTADASTYKATLSLGFYSLNGLMNEIKRAMDAADLDNVYTITADRTVNAGTENRVTIATNGADLELLFNSGDNSGANAKELLGFGDFDYTGDTSYDSIETAGTALITDNAGNNWIDPAYNRKVMAVIHESASGETEALIYSTKQLFQVQFPWILESNLSEWVALLNWMTVKRPIDFTPEIHIPNTFYESILESTAYDTSGLGFSLVETPKGTGLYDSGLLKFRVKG